MLLMIQILIIILFCIFCVAQSGKDESSGSNLGYVAAGVGGFLILGVIVTVIIVTIVTVRKRSRTRYVLVCDSSVVYYVLYHCIVFESVNSPLFYMTAWSS